MPISRGALTALLTCVAVSARVCAAADGMPSGDAVLSEPVEIFRRGAELLKAEDWSGAEAALTRALDARPGDPDILALRGVALFHLGRNRDAEADLRAARDRTRYTARTLYYLGSVLGILGRADEARATFDRLLREYPGSPESERLERGAGRVPSPAMKVAGKSGYSLTFGYDTNVSRTADLPDEPGGESDGFLAFSGTVERSGANHTFGASLEVRDYLDLDRYDLVSVALRLEAGQPVDDRPGARLLLSAGQSWLGLEEYERRLGVGAGVRRRAEEGVDLSLGVTLSGLKYGPMFAGLDGRELLAEGRLLSRRAGRGVGLVVRIADVEADVSYLGYRESVVGGIWQRTGGSGAFAVSGEIGFGRRLYAAENPAYASIREDIFPYVQLTGVRRLGRGCFLRAQAAYSALGSNVLAFDYDHFVLGVGLLWTR